MSIQSHNPATEEILETFELYSKDQINDALEQARRAFLQWRETSFAERSASLHRVASHLTRAQSGTGTHSNSRDGQTYRRGGGGGREVRLELRLLCRAWQHSFLPMSTLRAMQLRAMSPFNHWASFWP